MSLDEPSRVQAIETNSYPFSTPMLSEDGDMLVYLSDADSTDVTDTEVRYSLSSGGGFPDGTAIPDGAATARPTLTARGLSPVRSGCARPRPSASRPAPS